MSPDSWWEQANGHSIIVWAGGEGGETGTGLDWREGDRSASRYQLLPISLGRLIRQGSL